MAAPTRLSARSCLLENRAHGRQTTKECRGVVNQRIPPVAHHRPKSMPAQDRIFISGIRRPFLHVGAGVGRVRRFGLMSRTKQPSGHRQHGSLAAEAA